MKYHTATKAAQSVILNLLIFAAAPLVASAAPVTVPNTFTTEQQSKRLMLMPIFRH